MRPDGGPHVAPSVVRVDRGGGLGRRRAVGDATLGARAARPARLGRDRPGPRLGGARRRADRGRRRGHARRAPGPPRPDVGAGTRSTARCSSGDGFERFTAGRAGPRVPARRPVQVEAWDHRGGRVRGCTSRLVDSPGARAGVAVGCACESFHKLVRARLASGAEGERVSQGRSRPTSWWSGRRPGWLRRRLPPGPPRRRRHRRREGRPSRARRCAATDSRRARSPAHPEWASTPTTRGFERVKGLRVHAARTTIELPWPELTAGPAYGLVMPRDDFDHAARCNARRRRARA